MATTRTIVVEGGRVVENAADIVHAEWKSGLLMEERLHAELRRFVSPDATFHELYAHMNVCIRANGFVKLDFPGNPGDSILRSKDERISIEQGDGTGLFPFEPHIGLPDSGYGFRREGIHCFWRWRIDSALTDERRDVFHESTSLWRGLLHRVHAL